MDGRELVILLLSLAIVAVVLRGLVVAVNARRGQIKLAIDKNMPSDVDLDALELAELPGGGARVVDRSLEQVNRQNSTLDRAETKAKALNLADNDSGESHIPVLMDAVELSEVRAEPDQYKPEETGIEAVCSNDEEEDDPEEFMPGQADGHSLGKDWDEGEELPVDEDYSDNEFEIAPVSSEQAFEDDEEQNDDDPVLFDHDDEDEEDHYEQQELNPLSAVAPDYLDEAKTKVDSIAEEQLSEPFENEEPDNQYSALDQGGEHESKNEEYADENYQNESVEDGYENGNEESEQESFDPVNNSDEFSMTAGERIGYNTPPIEETKQPNLFDEVDEDEQPPGNKRKKSRSLFALFGRKSAQQKTQIDGEPDSAPEIESEPIAIIEERQIEQEILPLEQERNEEPGESTVDELKELRSAPASAVIEELQPQSEVFEHAEVLVINVTARPGRVFAGDDLLHILITAGLKFGDMNIFHQRLSRDRQGAVIFSVANMLNPGMFDLNNMEKFTTLGISFFLALPTAINNLDAFEQMLDIAQDIRATLDGVLKDDHRNAMTAQTIEHYRQRIRDFELRRLKAVAARG